MAKRLTKRGPADSLAAAQRRAEAARVAAEAQTAAVFIHNGVRIEVPDVRKPEASISVDDDTLEVMLPEGTELEDLRRYCEEHADELVRIVRDIDVWNKSRKAARRIYDEQVAAAAAVRRDAFSSNGLYIEMLKLKTAAVQEAEARVRQADHEWQLRVALLDDLRRRLASAI